VRDRHADGLDNISPGDNRGFIMMPRGALPFRGRAQVRSYKGTVASKGIDRSLQPSSQIKLAKRPLCAPSRR